MASIAVLSAAFTASTSAVTAASGDGKRCCLTPAAKVDRAKIKTRPRPTLVAIQELAREENRVCRVRLTTASPYLERRRAAAAPEDLRRPGHWDQEADSAEPPQPADGLEGSRVEARDEGRERAGRWPVGSHDRVHRGHEHHRHCSSPETFRAPVAVRATVQVTGEQSPRVAPSRAENALPQDETGIEHLEVTSRQAVAHVTATTVASTLSVL